MNLTTEGEKKDTMMTLTTAILCAWWPFDVFAGDARFGFAYAFAAGCVAYLIWGQGPTVGPGCLRAT